MIWDRRKLFWGLTRIKLTFLCADKGLKCRRIFCRSTTSQALLKSINEVVDGLLRSFSLFSKTELEVELKLNPAIKRFLKGLHKSALNGLLFAARTEVLKDSGSSSGIFCRFFPTANKEFLWRDEGKEFMASFDKSSEIRRHIRICLEFLIIIAKYLWHQRWVRYIEKRVFWLLKIR